MANYMQISQLVSLLVGLTTVEPSLSYLSPSSTKGVALLGGKW